MPAVTSTTGEEPNDADSKMRNALKRHIIRERQRKKEEYEAEVEEERLRKEREARERQDVMTLEETKEQIDQLEQKIKQLEKEKQQLFMQLKKVLNEDEIRKRQQQKESNENMPPMKMSMGNIQIPMFPMPTSTGQGEPPPTQGRPPPLPSHMLNKNKHSNYMLFPQQQTLARGPPQAGVKRQRTPSPTYAMYGHRLLHPQMKHQTVYTDHKEDGRMSRQVSRAVLWNKQPQYGGGGVGGSSVSSSYYGMPSGVGGVGVVGERPPPLLYAHHAHAPQTPHTPHHAGLMYAPAPQPQIYLDMIKNRDGPQHQETKKEQQPQVLIGLSEAHHPAVSSGVVYAQPPPAARHLALHVPASAPAPAPAQHTNMQSAKPGSITQGYPVQQANPNVQNQNMYPNRHRY